MKRFLEVLNKTGPSSKLTVNPKTGRVTVKISESHVGADRDKILAITDQVMKMELETGTLRGKFWFHPNGSVNLCLQENSKKENVVNIKLDS